jgi:hypothetical protein
VPIQTERAGVFRGRRYNRDAWYVVDAPERELASREQEWRETHRPTNQPKWKRVASAVLGMLIGLTIFAGLVGGAGFLVSSLEDPIRSVLIGFIAVLGLVVLFAGIAVGFMVADRIFHMSAHPHVIDGVYELTEDVVEWASDDLPLDDLAKLGHLMDNANEVHELLDLGVVKADDEALTRIPPEVDRVLVQALETERARLVNELQTTADRLGFEVPARLSRSA